MEDFCIALAHVKATVPAPIWIECLKAFAEVANVEVLRFTRQPPKHDQNAAQLGWFQGRGSLAYELGAVFDECTKLSVKIRNVRQTKEAQDAKRSVAGAAAPAHSPFPAANGSGA